MRLASRNGFKCLRISNRFFVNIGSFALFVAASTRCFPDVTINKSLQKLADLEFNHAEIVIGYGVNDLQPDWLGKQDTWQTASRLCLSCRSIRPVAFYFDVPPADSDFLQKFEWCMRFSKHLGVATVVVKAAPVGSPYNEEFERLSKLVNLGMRYGVVVSLLTERDTVAGSIDSLSSFCNGIELLRVALDPSHFIYGYDSPVDYEAIIPKVAHVRLRDTTAKKFQVQIGQGVLEYNKLVGQLNKCGYDRAMCVDLTPLPNLDAESELRKMHLLVESLL